MARTGGLVFVAMTMVASIAAGCGGAAKEVARTAAPPAIDASLDAMRTPAAKARLQAVMGDPDVQVAITEFGRGMGRGLVTELGSPQRQAQMAALTDVLLDHVARSVARAADRELDPAMTRVVRSAAHAVVNELSGNVAPGNAGAFGYTLAEGAALGFDRALTTGLRDDLGPATETFLRDHVGRGVQDVLSPETNRALGGTARELGRQLVLGVNDALGEVNGSGRSILERATKPRETFPWSTAIAIALLAVVLALAGWVVSLRRRRAREDERARLAAAIAATPRPAASASFVDALADQLVTRVRARPSASDGARASRGSAAPRPSRSSA